jgi:hypothetical protein
MALLPDLKEVRAAPPLYADLCTKADVAMRHTKPAFLDKNAVRWVIEGLTTRAWQNNLCALSSRLMQQLKPAR